MDVPTPVSCVRQLCSERLQLRSTCPAWHCRHPCNLLFEGGTAGWRGEGGDQPQCPKWGSEPTAGYKSNGMTPPLCSPACVLQDGYTTACPSEV